MRLLLLAVIMVTVFLRATKACPATCECNDFPRDPLRNDNNSFFYTSVTCDREINAAAVPATISKLIFRNFSQGTVEAVLERLGRFPYLFRLDFVECIIPNLNISFGSLERLQSLDLSGSKLKHFQETAFNLTGLKALDLSNNEIRAIENSPFRTLSSLEMLNLSANVIEAFHEDAFKGLLKLQHLDISSNKLTLLQSSAFVPLSILQQLNLSNNLLQVLDEACLSSLQRLQQLDVSWNRLSRVAPGSLQLPSLSRLLLAGNPGLGESREPVLLVGPGKRLQTVDASQTGLKQVPAALTHSIRTLRLAGNSIRSVNCGHLDSYPLLQLLDFTSNDLKDIEDDALGRLELLSILYLSDNKLTSIPRNLPERLRILHLEHNRIELISQGDLQGMPRLEVLLLSDNKVKVVREGAFSQLGALATLDLSGNLISALPAGTLSGPLQLQVLRLSNLNVISLAKELAFPLPSPEHLITLDLSHSPGLGMQFLADTAALAASRELQELDLSSDRLQNIRSDLLHFLPQLRTLRLTDNFLNCSELQWLATWMRRQDQPESRKVTCFSPTELSGSLLIDLQAIDSATFESVTRGFPRNPDLSTRIKEVNFTQASAHKTRSESPKGINITHSPLELSTLKSNLDGLSSNKRTISTAASVQIARPNTNNFLVEVTTKHSKKQNVNVFSDVPEISKEEHNYTSGKMSMFTESREKKIPHPGLLVALAGVLSAAAVVLVAASKFRKRQRNCQQQDIEVSSLSSVTELW